jgi:hypothetical protein
MMGVQGGFVVKADRRESEKPPSFGSTEGRAQRDTKIKADSKRALKAFYDILTKKLDWLGNEINSEEDLSRLRSLLECSNSALQILLMIESRQSR